MSVVDEWDGLLKHPGWLRLAAWARQHWSEEIEARLRPAANDPDDKLALQKIRQVLAAKAAVEQVLAYPDEQLKRAANQADRGVDDLIMSRRGRA